MERAYYQPVSTQDPTASSPSSAGSGGSAGLAGLKVLVADDSENDRKAACSALTAAGYRVVLATDGQQALEMFARERPDLVLLDVVMPRLTGLETCRILKAKTHSTYLPVIMVSTRNSVNARVEGLRSGADDYLAKPYDPDELRARVEVMLRTRMLVSSEPARPGTPEVESKAQADSTAFRKRLEEEFDRAERYSDPLACLRVELDHLQAISGSHSAETAMRLMAALHDIVVTSVRKIDLMHRVDGNGYMLVLPNTHFPGALAVAERIVKEVRKLDAESGLRITASVGVSFFPNKDTRSLQDLLDLVNAALERARNEGGGKICLYQHQGYLYAPEP